MRLQCSRSRRLAAIVVWNLAIARDFIDLGKRNGEAIGSTGRYVASHKTTPGQMFYIATSDASPYFLFGGSDTAIDRLELFADSRTQIGQPIDPFQLRTFNVQPPLALFMTRDGRGRARPRPRQDLSARPDSQHHARRRVGRPRSPGLGHAPAPERHWVRSSPLANCSQAWRFPSLSACCVPRIVPIP